MRKNKILALIESLKADLPKAEARVAEQIVQQPQKIIRMTAAELGQLADASAATVIRLTKRLQVESFTDLKMLVMSDLDAETTEIDTSIQAGESIEQVSDKIYWNSLTALESTRAILDEGSILKAIQVIHQSDVMYVFGIGASSLVAENLAQKFNRAGKTCLALQDAHILIASMMANDKKACFIAVSNSGETHEVLKINEMALEQGYHSIAVTQFGSSSLTKQAEINLHHVRSDEAKNRNAATTSLHAQFMVVDILFYAYLSSYYQETMDKLSSSRSAVQDYNRNGQIEIK